MSKSSPTIEELRGLQEFIPWDKWPKDISSNCFGYALGLPYDDPIQEVFGHMFDQTPITKISLFLNSLGLTYYRRIASEKELKSNEYGIVVYHYFYQAERHFFGVDCVDEAEEIHLARIELDGTWTHKFRWDYEASITTPKEIHDIILRDDKVDVNPVAMFAVKRP